MNVNLWKRKVNTCLWKSLIDAFVDVVKCSPVIGYSGPGADLERHAAIAERLDVDSGCGACLACLLVGFLLDDAAVGLQNVENGLACGRHVVAVGNAHVPLHSVVALGREVVDGAC